MQLLILRHGQAEPLHRDDARRELTEQGRAQVEWICQQRAQQLAQLRGIWASPLVRAQQTAHVVATKLKLAVITNKLLSSETPPQQLLDTLGQISPEKFPLLLVSHQPLVGSLVNGLCDSGKAHPMGTASLACLEADVWVNGCAELSWLEHAEK